MGRSKSRSLAVLSVKSGALSSTPAKLYFGATGLALGTVYGLTDWKRPLTFETELGPRHL